MVAAFVGGAAFDGCAPVEPESQERIVVTATNRPTFTPWPTNTLRPELPTVTPETEIKRYVVKKETGLPEIAGLFPIFDEKDLYFPWYRWNGGERLFEPLAIPEGTILFVPVLGGEPLLFPPLPEISTPAETWENQLAVQTTSLEGSSDKRMQNIRTATEKLDGTIIEPFRLFSMRETLGPFTEQEGYVMGWGYTSEGEVPMFAGGICQLPSTLFLPAAKAGMLVILRYPHLYYGPNYGPWDATVSEDLDFTFRNLYRYPVQIRARVNEEEETLTVGVWSPFASVYEAVQLDTLYNRQNPDGTREAAVRQKVIMDGRVRIRDYYSRYLPKPSTPSP